MTEAELLEVSANITEAVISTVTLYLSVVSAYLVVAYIVGKQLSTFQVTVINVLFVVFAMSFVMGIQTGFANLYSLSKEILDFRPEWAVYTSPLMNRALFVLDVGGILASLIFMWNVRHPRKE